MHESLRSLRLSCILSHYHKWSQRFGFFYFWDIVEIAVWQLVKELGNIGLMTIREW